MAGSTSIKTPVADADAPPPATHEHTKALEEKIKPQHHTTEAYGTSDEDARAQTER